MKSSNFPECLVWGLEMIQYNFLKYSVWRSNDHTKIKFVSFFNSTNPVLVLTYLQFWRGLVLNGSVPCIGYKWKICIPNFKMLIPSRGEIARSFTLFFYSLSKLDTQVCYDSHSRNMSHRTFILWSQRPLSPTWKVLVLYNLLFIASVNHYRSLHSLKEIQLHKSVK